MGDNFKLLDVVFVDMPFHILTKTLVLTIDRSLVSKVVTAY